MKGKRHTDRVNGTMPVLDYACSNCGKTYSHRQSLHVHKMSCASPTNSDIMKALQEERKKHQLELEKYQKDHQLEREQYQKDHNELKAQLSLLLDKQMQTAQNTTTSTNCNNNNTTNIENQHINININAFGKENTDYIDDKAILACIGRVYKSIPSLLEKIHFDPNHPENHNIKITNKKLPYASVMGNNQKWKTVDRKDAIETMVINGYNMLDEKYAENKEKISATKRQNFEGFQSKFESEDKDLMKQIRGAKPPYDPPCLNIF